jgi:tellurite resistance protein TerC
MLAGAIGRFRYLKAGLSVVLVFIGAKMLVDPHGHEPKWYQFEISTAVSLLVILLVLSLAITWSLLARTGQKPE